MLGSSIVVAELYDATRWVAARSRRLAKDRRPSSAGAAAELAARAALAFAVAFDLAGAFRGFAALGIRAKCRQEAVRLRNGGTFHRARPECVKGVSVCALPAEPDHDEFTAGRGGGVPHWDARFRPLSGADLERHRGRRLAIHTPDTALGARAPGSTMTRRSGARVSRAQSEERPSA